MSARRPTEMGRALHALGHGLPTCIERYRGGTLVGRFGLIGRIPADLTRPVTTPHTPQIPPLRRSMDWATEQEVIDALLALGITHFQCADLTWYDAPKAV